jgi:hypothetical protein
MSQFPGDVGSKILASGYKYNPYGGLQKPSPPAPQDKKSEQGAPLPTNPVSEVEGLFGVRMSKAQKWALVIGITLALYGVTIYVNKK